MSKANGLRALLGTTMAVILAGVLLLPMPVSAAMVYFADFQSGTAGPEWSYTGDNLQVSSTLLPADGSRKYLGSFLNETVTLTLTGAPVGYTGTISFDLYLLKSWDGNSTQYGPDYWKFWVNEGTVFTTTFANVYTHDQSYPDSYYASHPHFTGAAEHSTLGENDGYDAVYRLSFTTAVETSTINFHFAAAGLTDEVWGLDNVQVDVVPLPATLPLLASGLLGLLGLRKCL